jgi:hypothetical protein
MKLANASSINSAFQQSHLIDKTSDHHPREFHRKGGAMMKGYSH